MKILVERSELKMAYASGMIAGSEIVEKMLGLLKIDHAFTYEFRATYKDEVVVTVKEICGDIIEDIELDGIDLDEVWQLLRLYN